jgi:peptidoglycan/LPS O-acetylase OafA/YrhL
MSSSPARLTLVDAIKASAAQLIVWRHLAFYGPMCDAVHPYASGLLDWLYEYARAAVQAFLVAGGFLAARSLAARAEAGRFDLPALLWRRYLRLARPYWAALGAAIAAAALARALITADTTPAAPTLAQVAAHVVLLLDILKQPALSAGVWYVAIDFQLFACLAAMLWLGRMKPNPAGWWLSLSIGAGALSLFLWNRNPALDIWAPYFFGAYSLGVVSQWISRQTRRASWMVLLAAVVGAALALEWRSRILVAGLTALALAADRAPQWLAAGWIASLSRISYAVFLIHYPVCLAVGAVVHRLWPGEAGWNAAGMVVAWLLSLGAGAGLHRAVERV